MLLCEVLVAMRISDGDDGGRLPRECVGWGVDGLQQFCKSLVECRCPAFGWPDSRDLLDVSIKISANCCFAAHVLQKDQSQWHYGHNMRDCYYRPTTTSGLCRALAGPYEREGAFSLL